MNSNSNEQINTKNNSSRNRLMKSIMGLLMIVAVYFIACIVLQTSNPIGVVASNSMQPTLSRGDIILLRGAAPVEIAKGDIITFDVSGNDQAKYHYPKTVTHRVTEIELNNDGLSFHTQGDNTQPDPFVVSSKAVKGTPFFTIPKVGYAILMLQSRQGLILLIGLASIWLVYAKGNKFLRKTHKLQERVAYAVNEHEPTRNEQQMLVDAQRALEGFSSAMTEYAYHLKSHTGVMMNLDQTTKYLKDLVKNQTELFARIGESLESVPQQTSRKTEDNTYDVVSPDDKVIISGKLQITHKEVSQ